MLHASARLGNSNTQTKHGLGDRSTSFGYQPPPERTQPARQVYQWLGSLSLSIPLQSPRRDLSNGYLVVEILSHYYPVSRVPRRGCGGRMVCDAHPGVSVAPSADSAARRAMS
jgi:hypothetical protein